MADRLRRALGLSALTFYGVGQILGAGIYTVIGAAAGAAGSALWLSFVVAAIAALLTGLSYAELATTYPQAGAEYVYVSRALPGRRWAPFVTGFVIVVAGSGTAATVALAFGGYGTLFVSAPPEVLALGVLAAVTIINIAGIQQSSLVNIAFTLVEAVGLVVVIALGVARPEFGAGALARIHPGVLTGAALIFFSYLGFEDIANLAEEARDPARHLPRAILVSLAVTTALYVLVGLAAVALAPAERLAESESPLATAVAAVSPRLAGALGGIALFATANTALITLIVTSRMLYGMARGGDMPPALASVLPRRQTPWLAALVALGAAVVLLPLGRVAVVASLSSFGALTAFVIVHLCVVALRYRDPQRERPFRVPLAIGRLPVLPILGLALALGLLVQFEALVYAVGAIAAAAGLAVYLARRWWR